MSDDYYKLLDVEESATMEDIKKSYYFECEILQFLDSL